MIYEGKRYGIFSHEVDPIIALVQSGASRECVRAHRCPKCGAQLTATFWPDGCAFVVACDGPVQHMSQAQGIAQPPDWWRESIHETTDWLVSWKRGAEPGAPPNAGGADAPPASVMLNR